MKQQKMTNKEWLESLLSGQPADRVPLYPSILGFSARKVGYPLATIYSDPHRSFEAYPWTQEQYGFDWGSVYGYTSYGTWEFGDKIKMTENDYEQAPSPSTFPVQSEEDIDGLELPDVTADGCLPLAMELARLQAKQGTPITLVFGGNFIIAGNIEPHILQTVTPQQVYDLDLPPENESIFMLDWEIRKGALNSEEILHTGTYFSR